MRDFILFFLPLSSRHSQYICVMLDKSKYITSDYAQSAMHMQFMQMNQHRLAQSNAAMMSSEMQAQAQQLQRAIEENNNKNSNIAANLNRANLWETCSASYESFVKNLERFVYIEFLYIHHSIVVSSLLFLIHYYGE